MKEAGSKDHNVDVRGIIRFNLPAAVQCQMLLVSLLENICTFFPSCVFNILPVNLFIENCKYNLYYKGKEGLIWRGYAKLSRASATQRECWFETALDSLLFRQGQSQNALV